MYKNKTVLGFAISTFLIAVMSSAPADSNDDVAIIIGNKNYSDRGIPQASYALRDARAILHFVKNIKHIPKENIIYAENASQAVMTTIFGHTRNHRGKANQYIKPEKSNLIVYYSGHGFTGLSDHKKYLIPTDADVSTIDINGISLETLVENLRKIDAKSVTLILETSFSGTSHNGPLISKASGAVILPREKQSSTKSKINIFYAAASGQVSTWDDTTKHSLFTYELLDGLYGKADLNHDTSITLGELNSYIGQRVEKKTRHIFSRQQTPILNGNENFVFSKTPSKRVAFQPNIADKIDIAKTEQKLIESTPAYEKKENILLKRLEKRLSKLEKTTNKQSKTNENLIENNDIFVHSAEDGLAKLISLIEHQKFNTQSPVKSMLRYSNILRDENSCKIHASMSFHYDQVLFRNSQASSIDIRNHDIEFDVFRTYKTRERVFKTQGFNGNIVHSFNLYKYGPLSFISEKQRDIFIQITKKTQQKCKKPS
ncbi:caspase family protein [Terasakiella sp.]|uniref:caspase family protein n=1 Tax=Terasakiella sp. TaxID=2034861 RepID=UPI003AA7D312